MINWTACEAPGGTREAGKSHFDSLGGAREAQGRLVAQDCRSNRGAGFCLIFNTISMANGPVRGKSWGGLHGRLPSADSPLKCRSEHRVPFDREAGEDHLDSLRGTREAGKDSLDSLRGTREAGKNQLNSLRGTREAGKDQLDSLRGTREAPGRQEKTAWTACEARRHQGGREEPFGQPGRHQGGRKGSIGSL